MPLSAGGVACTKSVGGGLNCGWFSAALMSGRSYTLIHKKKTFQVTQVSLCIRILKIELKSEKFSTFIVPLCCHCILYFIIKHSSIYSYPVEQISFNIANIHLVKPLINLEDTVWCMVAGDIWYCTFISIITPQTTYSGIQAFAKFSVFWLTIYGKSNSKMLFNLLVRRTIIHH